MYFSIICPVYNINESYLKKCIDSVLNQNFNDFELIIIDDGSSRESTISYLNKIKNSDNHLLLFSKENGGVSSARNFGIKKASGKYLLFLDGDDFLEEGMLEKLFLITVNKNIDILFFKFITYFSMNGNVDKIDDDLELKKIYEKEMIYYEILNPNNWNKINYGTPWGKIISNNLIKTNNISFKENLPRTQDRVFMLDCVYFAKCIYNYNYSGYNYNYNYESVCQNYNVNLWDKLYRVQKEFVHKCKIYNILKNDSPILSISLISFYLESLDLEIFHCDNKMSYKEKFKRATLIYNIYVKESMQNINLNEFNGLRKVIIILMKIRLKELVYILYIFRNKKRKFNK